MSFIIGNYSFQSVQGDKEQHTNSKIVVRKLSGDVCLHDIEPIRAELSKRFPSQDYLIWNPENVSVAGEKEVDFVVGRTAENRRAQTPTWEFVPVSDAEMRDCLSKP